MSTLYYIASLKHTSNYLEHITFWQRNRCGYTPVLGEYAGQYGEAEAAELNDGFDCIAVPVVAVQNMSSPEPYWKPGARFYDQRGPVVNNTRDNWKALIAVSMKAGRRYTPKPEPFKGKRRAIFTDGGSV